MSPQVMLITGASRGLGAATAREAARQGVHLVINARNAAKLEAVASACREHGVQAIAIAGDISEPETARRMVQAASEAFGRIDAVIHNAGVLSPIAPIAQADLAAWETNWRINLLAAVALLKESLPLLRETRGRVVMISSGAASYPYPTWGAYCVSKAALNHLTAVLAVEEPAITAIALRPGVVDTAMQAQIREQGADVMPPELYEKFRTFFEQGQLQPPEAVARPLVAVALRAPHAWSGQFINYADPKVQALLGA